MQILKVLALRGPSTTAIVEAARIRNILARRLNAGSVVQLGNGVNQRRIWTAETEFTSAIAVSIAQDKQLTKSILQYARIPVPDGRDVDSPEDAWEAAKEIDGPLIGKKLIAAVAGDGASVVGLDIAGIVLVVEDVSRTMEDWGGVIVEVNAGPGLLMHLKPQVGNPEPVGEVIVTNIGEADHLGRSYVDSPEDMFKVKRTPVDVVLPTGTAVLNAGDPVVAEMAELSAGTVTLFAQDPNLPAILRQRKDGHRAVIVRDGNVLLCAGQTETVLTSLAELPCTHGGRVGFQIENVLAATVAAWALKIPANKIANGLQNFQGNLVDNPARFNVLESAGKTLIPTDGRNLSTLKSLVESLGNFPHEKRSIVFAADADRRNLDIRRQGGLLGRSFDRVFLCEFDDAESRERGEVITLLKTGISASNRLQNIVEIDDWEQAVDAAWSSLGRAELWAVQSFSILETVHKVQTMLGLEPSETIAA